MFAIDHVIKCFSILDEVEKEKPHFSQAQKQAVYRIAFHREDFDDIQKLILQMCAPNLNTEERDRLLNHHLDMLPKMSDSILQIEDYIFQLQYMTYEKNKANQMLEEILSRSNLSQELDKLISEAKDHPMRVQAVKNEKTKK